MARLLLALAVLLIAVPALADTPTMLPGRMPSLSQGRGGGAAGFAPAPVPNPDLLAPTRPRDPNAVQVAPSLTRMGGGQAHGGDGFASGSAYTGDLERRSRGGLGSTLAPSLNLKMPVQVEFR